MSRPTTSARSSGAAIIPFRPSFVKRACVMKVGISSPKHHPRPNGSELPLPRHQSETRTGPTERVVLALGLGLTDPLSLQRFWNLSAIFRELDHYLLMQPDVHRSRVLGVARVVQLFRQLLARGKAAVQIEQLHQINDRVSPIELLLVLASEILEHGFDIDLNTNWTRGGRGRRAACAGCRGGGGCWTGCLAAAGGRT